LIYSLADEDEDDSDDEGRAVSLKGCSVVWEGKVLDRAFNDWKVSSAHIYSHSQILVILCYLHQVRYFHTENLARDHLKRHGVEHYWDLALSQTIVEQEGD